MRDINKDPIYSKNVMEMILVANEFCSFIEFTEKHSKEDILYYLQKVCPLLYLKGSLLPGIQVKNPEANERFVTEEQWQNIFNSLRSKFLNDDEYWDIENLDTENNEPEKQSLSENFADIYQDLKDFILLYQKNTEAAKENAVHQCSILFKKHWGCRIINSLKAIHYILYKDILNRAY